MDMTRQMVAVLTVCIALHTPAYSQQTAPRSRLRVVALEGDRAVNYIPIRTMTAPVVEVRDENERPVEGAKVTFTAPASGPGATFQGGANTYTTVTDFRGQAGAAGYNINDKPGRFQIRVVASYGDHTGQITMTQVNSMDQLPPEVGDVGRRSGKMKWVWLGIVAGAGAGTGIYFATRPNNTPISVGTGAVTIGGPR